MSHQKEIIIKLFSNKDIKEKNLKYKISDLEIINLFTYTHRLSLASLSLPIKSANESLS